MTLQGKTLTSDRIAINWKLDGPPKAPFLVLSNSLGTNRHMWDPQLEAFAADYRVLTYDTRGHGASDAPPGSYSLDRLGQDVVDLVNHLEIEQFHFCGLSLGGMTGQWLAIHASERIDRLVLANTASRIGPASAWQDRIETVLSKGMHAIAQPLLERWFTPEFIAQQPPALVELEAVLLSTLPQGYAGCCAAIRDADLTPLLSLIDRTTLVISGLRDPATPPQQGEALAAAIAGSQSKNLDTAHLSNVEMPEEFTKAVLEFLS